MANYKVYATIVVTCVIDIDAESEALAIEQSSMMDGVTWHEIGEPDWQIDRAEKQNA